MKKLMM